MLRTMRDMMLGAIICFTAIFAATSYAVIGVPPPTSGSSLIDGTWLNGLASGQNFTVQSGITAHAGGTQAACLQLSTGIYLYQVDTVASGNDSVCLPFAVAGTNLSLRNNGAQTLAIFPQIGVNALTAVVDQINNTTNTTLYAITAQQSVECFVAKNGSWSCSRGS